MASSSISLSDYMLYGDQGGDKKRKKKKSRGFKIPGPKDNRGRVKKRSPKEPPSAAYPQANTGTIIPYILGRQRVFDPKVLWFGNLQAKEKSTKKIKGAIVQEFDDQGFPVETPTQSVEETTRVVGWRLDVHLGVCLGPNVHLLNIFIDNSKKWEGDASGARTVIGSSSVNDNDFWADFIFYDGRYNQNFSGGAEIVGITPPNYVGVSIVSISGANATDVFPAIAFEVGVWPNPLTLAEEDNVSDKGDLNAITCAYDLIVNSWGGSGVSADNIDAVTFTAAATRIAEEGIFISIYNEEIGKQTDLLRDIEDMCMCKFYEDMDDGKIKVRLIRYDMFDPDAADNLIFDASNVSRMGSLAKESWVEATNKSVGFFVNREKNYNDDMIMAQTPMVTGSVRGSRVAEYDYPLCNDPEVTGKAFSRDIIMYNQPSWHGEFQCNRDGADLTVGQVFVLNWPENNVVGVPMYVVARRDIPNDVGVMVEFEELIDINGDVLFAVPEPSLFVPVDKNASSPVAAKVISSPYWVQSIIGYTDRGWDRRIRICTPIYLVEPYNKSQKSFDVKLLNYPNMESANLGDEPVINEEALYASTGQLVVAMSRTDGFSNGIISSILINGVVISRYLKSVDLEGVRDGSLFMFIDDEVLSFEGCVDQGGGVWELTNVHRGLMDTAPAAHNIGAKCWIVNGNWEDRIGMSFDVEPEYIPEFLFASRTPTGVQEDDGLLYTGWSPDERINKPLRPVATTLNGSRGSGSAVNVARSANVTVGWKTRSRNTTKKVAVFATGAATPEVAADGTWQTHRVYLTDSAATTHNLGATTSASANPNELAVTIPSGAATGAGYIWVQAQGKFGNAIQAERYPVNIT